MSFLNLSFFINPEFCNKQHNKLLINYFSEYLISVKRAYKHLTFIKWFAFQI